MSISKDDVLAAGIQVFREKGYELSSVQDIANACGISKASLYTFFSSKEEIFLQVFTSLQNDFKNNLKLLRSTKLDPKTQLVRANTLLTQLFSTDYLTLFASNDPHTDAIRLKKDEFGVWLLRAFKDLFIEAYGTKCEPFIWDLLSVWRALNREYTGLLAHGNLDGHSADQASNHLIAITDQFVDDAAAGKIPVFITSPIAQSFFERSQVEMPQSPELFSNFFDNIDEALVNLHSAQRADDIRQMISFLKTEIESEEPRWFLLHAIMDSLRKESELWSITRQLQQLLMTIHPGFEEW